MRKSRFAEEQIAFALRQAELGTKVVEVCRKAGHQRAAVLSVEEEVQRNRSWLELRRLKQLEEENRKLKRLVADLSLDKAMLQDVIAKKL